MSATEQNSDRDSASAHPWEEWAEALQQHVRSEPPPQELSRAWAVAIGLSGILLIALLFPVYDYHVQKALLERDLEAELREAEAAAASALQASQAINQAAAASSAEAERRRRIRAVRLSGVIDGEEPVAIVNLGSASTDEARHTICEQAERQLRRSLSGQLIKLQQTRGKQPATDAGWIRCP